MSVTYGFYNSLYHDRLYDAIQMSSIFDGIIRDGIFSTIGDCMVVTAPEDGLYVKVGPGRAWFNHTWTLNDADFPVEAYEAEVVLDRIDALVLEVNSSVEVRANSIKFVKGTPSSNPVKPTLTHTAEVNQYALAYVHISAGQEIIYQDDVENAIGTDETPFVTGLMQQVSITDLLTQWEAEFNTYFTNFQALSTQEFNTWLSAKVAEYTAWYAQMQTDMAADFTEFDTWFQHMKDQLDEDAAGHLQAEIDALTLQAQKGSHVIVTTTDSSLFNRSVYVRQGSDSVDTTFDSTGYAFFETVPFIGDDITVDSTNGTLTAYGTLDIPYFGIYSLNIEFWAATLDISSTITGLFERSITISKNGDVVGTTTFDNTGHATYVVHETGTYVLTATDSGGNNYETEVVVTEETTYPASLGTPDGKTVLPTDDIQIWLRCAGLNRSYTTLAEVLEDTTVFNILLQDTNACDYMARSTTWAEAEGQVPTMTSDTTPSGVVTASAKDANDPYVVFVDDGTYWTPASSSGWVQYQFPTAKCIRYAKILPLYTNSNLRLKNFEILGSNDGTNWDGLYGGIAGNVNVDNYSSTPSEKTRGPIYVSFPDNNTAYTYYRLNIVDTWSSNAAIRQLQFFEDVDITTNAEVMGIVGQYDYASNALLSNGLWADAIINSPYWELIFSPAGRGLVPIMTGNSTPSGQCIGSTPHTNTDLYYAFNDNMFNAWSYTNLNTAAGVNIGYVFDTPQVVKYAMHTGATGTTDTAEIQYSDDGTNWYSASDNYTITYFTPSTLVRITEPNAHRYWRAYRISASGNSRFATGRLQFFNPSTTNAKTGYVLAAPLSSVYYMDGNTPVQLGTCDANGFADVDWTELPTDEWIELYSTVAKDPDSLSDDYHKKVYISRDTTQINLMPFRTLYWYGRVGIEIERLYGASGWSYTQTNAYTMTLPTINTNNIVLSAAKASSSTYYYSGVGSSYPVLKRGRSTHSIAQGITLGAGSAGAVGMVQSKAITNTNQQGGLVSNINSTSLLHAYDTNYGFAEIGHSFASSASRSDSARSARIYSLWTAANTDYNFFSAANDIVTYEVGGVEVVFAETDERGGAYVDYTKLPEATYTLKSSVAKNPEDISLPYTKLINISANTKKVYLMPNGAVVYWYGWMRSGINNLVTNSGTCTGQIRDNSIYLTSSAGNGEINFVDKVDTKNYTKIKAHFAGARTSGSGNYNIIVVSSDVNNGNPISPGPNWGRAALSNTDGEGVYEGNLTTKGFAYTHIYISSSTNTANTGTAYAVWYE